ncbi:MAG: NUDIX hydrolase [Patescibacteria group bacterium]
MQKVFTAVKAIIVNKNKFLVIKEIINNKTVWDLPGGKIEYGETPYETLKREVKEEIGLDIEIIKLAGIFWFFKVDNKKQVVCNAFLCNLKIRLLIYLIIPRRMKKF